MAFELFGIVETPEQRLIRLLELGAVLRTRDGWGVWCYMCKDTILTIEYVPHHAWFEICADIQNDHMHDQHFDPEGE